MVHDPRPLREHLTPRLRRVLLVQRVQPHRLLARGVVGRNEQERKLLRAVVRVLRQPGAVQEHDQGGRPVLVAVHLRTRPPRPPLPAPRSDAGLGSRVAGRYGAEEVERRRSPGSGVGRTFREPSLSVRLGAYLRALGVPKTVGPQGDDQGL